MEEVFRVLRVGGFLPGSVSNVYSRAIAKAVRARSVEDVEELIGILKEKVVRVLREGFSEAKIQLYDSEELRKLLRKVGFENIVLNPILTITTYLPKATIKKMSFV